MNDEFSTKLHPEKDAMHGLVPVLKRKCYLQRQLAKALQKVLMVCSHVPVAPSKTCSVWPLPILTHLCNEQ